MIDTIPKELKEIIYNYKNNLEHIDKFQKTLNEIKYNISYVICNGLNNKFSYRLINGTKRTIYFLRERNTHEELVITTKLKIYENFEGDTLNGMNGYVITHNLKEIFLSKIVGIISNDHYDLYDLRRI